ncbi:MAG: site-specific integrase, partial [Rhizobium ruizarguesonis]
MNELLVIADQRLMAERAAWLENLAGERRLSEHTLDAYERDTRQFLTFLTGHLAGPATLRDIRELRPADFRAFLAARRKQGSGARSLGRNLAGLR